ncbi:MAG: ATP-grasp domain-containing protein [Chloroflexota bacterium]|nr:MAG: ATP-grasp domain-containing protein [Chloroflexota bacterium]
MSNQSQESHAIPNHQTTILALGSYFKGTAFLQQCKELGCTVYLLTKEKYKDADWPRESIDEMFWMPETHVQPDLTYAVSYMMRTRKIDRIVPLDDYDVEVAANLREHLRIPGMGETTVRHFRDKLAMRVQARDEGVNVPDFSPVLNYDDLREFMERVPAPWVLKPRSEAASFGIKKLNSQQELWDKLNELGDRQSYFVLEKFVPGDVFHVDSVIWEDEVLFAIASGYAKPPLSVVSGGGVFRSRNLPYDSSDAIALREFNVQVMNALRMKRGVTHAEYIKDADGKYYFLETAARVGGANLAEMIEAASGVNLWREWARVEVANARKEEYHLPPVRHDYAGITVCLAKQEWPDLSAYNDPEIVWKLKKEHHAGMIVRAKNPERVQELLNEYGERFATDFMAFMPQLDKPND